MKRVLLPLIALLLIIAGLAGCSKYTSHYYAVGFVRSNTSGSADMSFHEFSGSIVFRLKCKSESRAEIRYEGELEEGNITVYYDCGGTKKELFSICSGEEINSSGGELPEDTLYIIVEAGDTCKNGSFKFEVCNG